jgi:hypothetical protein
VVPKFRTLQAGATYIGVPARLATSGGLPRS